MSWDIWDPFQDIKTFHREIDRLFKEIYTKPIEKKELIRQPLTDITETKENMIVRMEIPGISKKDIELKITDEMITIKAQKKTEAKEEKEGYCRKERSYTSFQRAFRLPKKVKSEKAEAKLEEGILKITIPKAKPELEHDEKVKRVEIK